MEITKQQAIRMIRLAKRVNQNASAVEQWIIKHPHAAPDWSSAFDAAFDARWDANLLFDDLTEAFVSDATVAEPVAPSEAG